MKEPRIDRTIRASTESSSVHVPIPGRKRPLESSPRLSNVKTYASGEETATVLARGIVPTELGPSTVPFIVAATSGDPRVGRSSTRDRSGDHQTERQPRLSESLTQLPLHTESRVAPQEVVPSTACLSSSSSSSSELRCLQVPQITIRSTTSSNDRPLVNPTFWAPTHVQHSKSTSKDSLTPASARRGGSVTLDLSDSVDRVSKPLQSALKVKNTLANINTVFSLVSMDKTGRPKRKHSDRTVNTYNNTLTGTVMVVRVSSRLDIAAPDTCLD
ncbi:unnamed protein product [Echinostoma caproni]|uniref:Uncharacterized protein n=1 Tax=Echinostoma caproni TaxID=27848 RepID=A0A3P8LC88_9TREM|nr:unnamed protein product [Echinostoma caproni]